MGFSPVARHREVTQEELDAYMWEAFGDYVPEIGIRKNDE